ncbi:hypothetical protein [Lentibacillus sediminis]|nr:hypothetical protein [Lentibacillus sediminis]
MEKIISDQQEGKEWLLIMVAVLSLATFKKIKRLELYKEKLQRNFKYFE